jgi:hypothetical protein
MVNYNKANIYKLCCKDINIKEIYVGSTTNFKRRKNEHKSSCYNENSKKYNYNVYRFIRANYGWENWDMVLVKKVVCETKLELHKIEREYVENLGATLNKVIPNRSPVEYRENNRESIKDKNKAYRKDNKDKYKAYQKEWRENNKKYSKEYREDNREKLKEKRKLRTTCICGTDINFSNKSKHLKNNKHRILISKIKKPLHEELLKMKI